jgi:hypothetical protein
MHQISWQCINSLMKMKGVFCAFIPVFSVSVIVDTFLNKKIVQYHFIQFLIENNGTFPSINVN